MEPDRAGTEGDRTQSGHNMGGEGRRHALGRSHSVSDVYSQDTYGSLAAAYGG